MHIKKEADLVRFNRNNPLVIVEPRTTPVSQDRSHLTVLQDRPAQAAILDRPESNEQLTFQGCKEELSQQNPGTGASDIFIPATPPSTPEQEKHLASPVEWAGISQGSISISMEVLGSWKSSQGR